jgi:hypothetical protein
MKRYRSIKLFISDFACKLALLALLIPLATSAQQAELSSEQVYEGIASASTAYQFETLNDRCPSNDRSGFMGMCITESFKKEAQLRELLKKRADMGEPAASFYWGVLIAESQKQFVDSNITEARLKARNQSFQLAIGYFKKACSGGVATACWNIGNFLVNGYGETKSGLAAAEWYYKAGLRYLDVNERDRALASLEEIRKIDVNHPLAKKLEVHLQKGIPK